MDDECKDCYKNIKWEIMECENCHCKTMTQYWEMPCIIHKCTHCGWGVVGAGFWAPCVQDTTKFRVKLVMDSYTKEDILTVSRIFNMPVLHVRNSIMRQEYLKKELSLRDLKQILAELKKKSNRV